ncbi:YcxB family protein [Moraxella sp. VT-16-12]|uniref:YcxB family protein n=1 Tax=Moraxella sp. VT-16-12 TaxID=2014877 RepID=UPI000B7FED84|nr:YcxB family protein [Moraxella sp. VT-16-12]TWV83932.1 YcxB family protein [Moraxella sp. VT-16-12]
MSQKPKQALYPYTLQPVALDMSDAEFRNAQLALFEKSVQAVSLKSVRTKEWIILGITVALAVLGLIFVNGYSTIIFWIMLVGVVIYLLLRTLGMQWYMRREFDKQVSEINIPDEMYALKLGVQKHGLIMTIPAKSDILQNPQMRGMTMRSAPTQQGVLNWSAVTQWDETDDFVFIMFEMQGQKGSQIIPKRLNNKGLPINTIIKHLQEITPKGLKTDGMMT